MGALGACRQPVWGPGATPPSLPACAHAGDGELPVPAEQVPAEEALMGHTARAADAAQLGHLVGRLTRGRCADFVVLTANPLQLRGGGGERLPAVVSTYVDGTCAWGACRAAAAASA